MLCPQFQLGKGITSPLLSLTASLGEGVQYLQNE